MVRFLVAVPWTTAWPRRLRQEHPMNVRPTALALSMTTAVLAAQSAGVAQSPEDESAAERTVAAELRLRQPGASANEALRVARGFRIAPVRLDMRGKDPLLVGLGSYLVNAAGGCNDCHTTPSYAPDGNPFEGEPKKVNTANYLAGGATFGPFTSRNLTPEPQSGLPAGLTHAQFVRTIRTGVDLKQLHPQISPLLQVMPWPVYQDLTDRDLRAIYEYLRAIPHAEPGTPEPPAGG
jgi:hypothetical protein